MMGWQVIGDAWERQSRTETPRDYLRVLIDDPLCPISAALFPDPEGISAQLVMTFGEPCRPQRKQRDHKARNLGDGRR